jgi:methylmalonyl-CoA mutase cobalamin-binding domain/chain
MPVPRGSQPPLDEEAEDMSVLNDVIAAVGAHHRDVEGKVRAVRRDPKAARELMKRWKRIREKIDHTITPTGLTLPRLALPELDEPGAVARFLNGEGLPGEFPFTSGIYREIYLDSAKGEEPMRLFAGLGLAEDTNARFHYLTAQQKSIRLSTAFDGPTLYGMDSDATGVFGKIGEGGVAIDTIDDMERLYSGFQLGDEHLSISMTINGPAPILLAMFVAAAKRKFGLQVVRKLRGTVQADVLKEVQAQNEILFPIDASLRFLTDMVEYTTQHMPRWYPISISGYHIAEAGATPIQQAAYTLANGLTYVELFRQRGMDINSFGPRLSFFLDCGLDIEYLALARVCRRIWAIAMRDVFGGDRRSQLFKLHTQTSGRSLVAPLFANNLTRTAIELILAYSNGTNSCHSNSADEAFTTPSEQWVRLAANSQAILLEESGLFKHMTNALGSSPGMAAVERAVEEGILTEFAESDRLGGVLAAVERRYQRSQIQESAHRYETQIGSGERPIVGVNRYRPETEEMPRTMAVRTSAKKKRLQISRVREFKRTHRREAGAVLDRLEHVVTSGGNVFPELIETVEHCSLGQITERLYEVVGRYRPAI